MHDKWPSTYELLFKEKPNYRNLYSMFLVAYVKRFKYGSLHRKKDYSQSIKEMLVGDDIKSDGKLFYVPRTKSIYDLQITNLIYLILLVLYLV